MPNVVKVAPAAKKKIEALMGIVGLTQEVAASMLIADADLERVAIDVDKAGRVRRLEHHRQELARAAPAVDAGAEPAAAPAAASSKPAAAGGQAAASGHSAGRRDHK